MRSFKDKIKRVSGVAFERLGDPCLVLKKSVENKIHTRVIIKKDVEVFGVHADVVELQTIGSLLVADVGNAGRGDVVIFDDMSYHVRRPLSNNGTIVKVQLLPDPELHLGLTVLEPADHLNQFVQYEWSDLWGAVAEHRTVRP